MISNRSQPLGGEGCPAADITTPAEKRNIFAVLSDGPRALAQVHAEQRKNEPARLTHPRHTN